MATGSPTLFLGASLGLLGSLLYLLVGGVVMRRARHHDPAGASPLRWFALFWVGLGSFALVNNLWALTVAGGLDLGLPTAVTVLHVKIVVSLAGFFGLVTYLLTVYRGSQRVAVPVGLFYVGLFAVLQWWYAWRQPVGIVAGPWGAGLEYARSWDPVWNVIVLLLFGPPLLSAIAYAWLGRVVEDPGQRLRVAVISASFVVLFGGLTLGWMSSTWFWWGLAEKILAIAVNLGVLAVIEPPEWVRRRVDLTPLGSDSEPTAGR